MKKGLVLEGGALRGLFTVGVMDVLMEAGVEFDGVVGVSAGACFGCNYKSGQRGRVLRYNLRYAHDLRYCSLWSLLTTGGIFGPRFAYRTLPERLDRFDVEAFDRSPMEFHLVATDVDTGEAVYRRFDRFSEEMYDWILASSSMPIVSRVVDIHGQRLLDGGIADSIPLRYFQEQGFERNLVVLTQPLGYEKQALSHQRFIRFALRRYPALVDAWMRRHEMYNAELNYIASQESAGNALLLYPSETLPIGHISHSRRRMQQTYDLGRACAEARLEEIKKFSAPLL
ncbi:MAG: patatin family protein [Bacteroidaceae bacterium]|nr:patatin family protein [Bacteroidaceae bacterium]